MVSLKLTHRIVSSKNYNNNIYISITLIFCFWVQLNFHIFNYKRKNCIVLSSILSDRYNLKDQFHINKRLHFWCVLFILMFLCLLLCRVNEWNMSRPHNQILFSPHHFLFVITLPQNMLFHRYRFWDNFIDFFILSKWRCSCIRMN